jgi:hypothetical protein
MEICFDSIERVLLLYSQSSTDRAVTRQRIVEIFTETRDKADMSANITTAYRPTGVYPINLSVITDTTFAPSLLKHSVIFLIIPP